MRKQPLDYDPHGEERDDPSGAPAAILVCVISAAIAIFSIGILLAHVIDWLR